MLEFGTSTVWNAAWESLNYPPELVTSAHECQIIRAALEKTNGIRVDIGGK